MARSKPKEFKPSAQSVSTASLIEAERLLNSGQLALAASVLNELQSRIQDDPRIFMMAMRLAEAAGEHAAALKGARQAVAVAPEWAPAVLELALCLARQNQFREAAEVAEQAVGLAPRDFATLEGAVRVAHRAGYAAMAIKYLPQLIELAAPDNAAFRLMLAQDLAGTGREAEALAEFDTLLAERPDDEAALEGRAQAAARSGDCERAVADWKRLLAKHPDNDTFRYHLAVAEGQAPATQPASMPRELFDKLATVYDQHMVRDLRYRLPKEVGDWALGQFPERKLNVLDLGCGTGLLGVCLGKLDGFLIGVDLSEKMIEQAARHQLYHRFHKVNLLDALRETPPDLYDLVAALDVFIYAGELDRAIPDGLRITKPGGYFVFSCEHALEDEPDCVLRPSNRYAHKRSHVESLCKAAGCAELEVRDIDLRLEGSQPVKGYWVIARKNPAA